MKEKCFTTHYFNALLSVGCFENENNLQKSYNIALLIDPIFYEIVPRSSFDINIMLLVSIDNSIVVVVECLKVVIVDWVSKDLF